MSQSIYLKTFGCSHNQASVSFSSFQLHCITRISIPRDKLSFSLVSFQSDSEYMAGQLSSFGYAVTDDPEVADLWLINT